MVAQPPEGAETRLKIIQAAASQTGSGCDQPGGDYRSLWNRKATVLSLFQEQELAGPRSAPVLRRRNQVGSGACRLRHSVMGGPGMLVLGPGPIQQRFRMTRGCRFGTIGSDY